MSSVLIAIPVPLHAVRLAGGVLGLAAGGWIAYIVRQPARAGVITPQPSRLSREPQ